MGTKAAMKIVLFYTCYLLSNLKVHCATTVGDGVKVCPNKLTAHSTITKSYSGKCYQFVDKEVMWNRARDICSEAGGKLAEIYDLATAKFLKMTLNQMSSWNNEGVWIGGTEKNGKWYWATGKAMSFTDWAPGEPGGIDFPCFGGDCVLMRRGDRWKWSECFCNTFNFVYKFICQFDEADTGIFQGDAGDSLRLGIGIGVGVALAVVLALGICIGCCIWRRRRISREDSGTGRQYDTVTYSEVMSTQREGNSRNLETEKSTITETDAPPKYEELFGATSGAGAVARGGANVNVPKPEYLEMSEFSPVTEPGESDTSQPDQSQQTQSDVSQLSQSNQTQPEESQPTHQTAGNSLAMENETEVPVGASASVGDEPSSYQPNGEEGDSEEIQNTVPEEDLAVTNPLLAADGNSIERQPQSSQSQKVS